MPCTSSGEVSTRARITLWPCALRCTASSASNTSSPEAAPGEAGRPLASTVFSALGSSVGCSSWSSWSALMLVTACSRVISPSSAMSTAILSAACVERLPERVCSMNSLPSCTVNSMSWMSWKCASSLAQAAFSSANTSGMSAFERRPLGVRGAARGLGQRLGRAQARHHVLALRIDQELAVKLVGAGRRIAREHDAGRALARPYCRTPWPGW